jgi:hypothetical protein
MEPTKRFRIAFSFAGEKRDFVGQVAAILARLFGREHILYDKYHEAEFARYDHGIYLPKLGRNSGGPSAAQPLVRSNSRMNWTRASTPSRGKAL